MDWFVRENALSTTGRTGGINALKGFEFQKSYAVWLLTKLLTGEDEIAMVRYEGAQDIDLMHTSGRQIHIQVKKYDKTALNLDRTSEVINSFIEDYRDAVRANNLDPADGLRFRLVAVAEVTDIAVLDIARGKNLRVRVPQVAKKISGKAPPKASLWSEVRAVMERLDVTLYPVSCPSDMYQSLAESKLSRFGIPAEQMDDAIGALINMIRWREDIRAREVVGWLSTYLPDAHPGSGRGPIRLAPGTSVQSNKPNEAFYSSQSTIWPAILSDADIRRDDLASVMQAILDPARSKILISGPSGAGKSTLARRAAWDLAQRGLAVVLEVVDANNIQEAWGEALNLSKRQRRGDRTVLVIADDLPDHEGLIDLVAELPNDSKLKVIATTWRARPLGLRLGEGLTEIRLDHISVTEAEAAAAKLNRPLDELSEQEVERIRRSGQLLLLNLVLLGEGSIERFAGGLLDRLRAEAEALFDPYLDLCVFGRLDGSVPKSILIRRNRAASRLLNAPETSGLVFPVGAARMRSGHRLLSAAVVAASGIEPVERMLEVASFADLELEAERRFAVGAIEDSSAEEHVPAALASRKTIAGLAKEIARTGDYLDIRRTSHSLIRIGLKRQAEEIGAEASEERIRTGADAAMFRSEKERVEPERTFDVLFTFYDRNGVQRGWRNFLRFASTLTDEDRRRRALDQARKRLQQPDLQPADGKVVIDLLTAIVRSPDWAEELIHAVMRRFPASLLIARSVAQAVIQRIRSATAFKAFLDYSLPQLHPMSVEGIQLTRNLTSAAIYSEPGDRLRLLLRLKALVAEQTEPRVRGILLNCCARIAEREQFGELLDMIGPAAAGEDPGVNRARHIIARRSGSAVAPGC
jgi:Adenylylsulphate kinase